MIVQHSFPALVAHGSQGQLDDLQGLVLMTPNGTTADCADLGNEWHRKVLRLREKRTVEVVSDLRSWWTRAISLEWRIGGKLKDQESRTS